MPKDPVAAVQSVRERLVAWMGCVVPGVSERRIVDGPSKLVVAALERTMTVRQQEVELHLHPTEVGSHSSEIQRLGQDFH